MKFEELPISCDLSETSMDTAAVQLGVSALHQLKLYTTRHEQLSAYRLQAVHGMQVVIVPDALMPSIYTWALESDAGRLCGSKGCV